MLLEDMDKVIEETNRNTTVINHLERTFQKIILDLRENKKKYKMINQYCKYCGSEMGYDYSVSDAVWSKIYDKYGYNILCIHCFCRLYPGNLEDVEFELFKGYEEE